MADWMIYLKGRRWKIKTSYEEQVYNEELLYNEEPTNDE